MDVLSSQANIAGYKAVLLAATLFALIYSASMSFGMERLEEAAKRRLDLGAVALESSFSRFDYLPTLLETTPEVQAVLQSPTDPRLRHAANLALMRINAIAGSDIVFVLEPGGLSLASSDWNTPESTAGHWYDYRPYMTQALETAAAASSASARPRAGSATSCRMRWRATTA